MIFHATTLQDALTIHMEKHSDERGHFARTMCQREFAARGLANNFVQGNTSGNIEKGTLRGLHFQQPPHAEVKLIRCTRGAIFDVIVDFRPGSETFLRWEGFELSEHNDTMLYVPEGFAHGYQTLEPGSEVSYLVTAFYTPGAESGLRYNDPALGIRWPLPVSRISPKDASWPLLDADAASARAHDTTAGRAAR